MSAYAVISTAPVTYQNPDGTTGTYATGTIVNMIEWDGVMPYNAGVDRRLATVPSGFAIGQVVAAD